MHKTNHSQTAIKQRIALIIFGLFLTLVILKIGLRLGGFLFLSIQEHRNRISIKQKGVYRILCLGESTTAFGDNDSYPSQLQEILNQKNTGVKFTVVNKGVPSINTSYILAELEQNLDRYKPDIVTAMIGVNDAQNYIFYRDASSPRIENFLKNLRIYKLAKLIAVKLADKLKGKKSVEAKKVEKSSMVLSKKTDIDQIGDVPGKGKKANPDYLKGFFIAGKICMEQRKFSKAQMVYEKIIKNSPKDELRYIELGKVLKKQQECLKAEELFKKFMEQGAKDDFTYLELGRVYRKQGVF